MMRVSSSAEGRAARLGDAARLAGCTFFDEHLPDMADSVRNEATRPQGHNEHRSQTGPTA
jgi:hypothetical protein